jgi:folylpolyglutamate synthase/dihydropteroate synthase
LESLGKSFQIQKNIGDACQLALSLSGVDDFILITGSFFVVSEAMQYFNNLNPQKLN